MIEELFKRGAKKNIVDALYQLSHSIDEVSNKLYIAVVKKVKKLADEHKTWRNVFKVNAYKNYLHVSLFNAINKKFNIKKIEALIMAVNEILYDEY
jgi:hypothetical protein